MIFDCSASGIIISISEPEEVMAKIVFCEDSPVTQNLIRAILRTTAHELHFASGGLEGLRLIDSVRPDVVFTDIHMEEMTGLQLCARIKARPDLLHIPIVLMTASVQSSFLEVGYRNGASDHIIKPFTPEELRAKVEKFAGDTPPAVEDDLKTQCL